MTREQGTGNREQGTGNREQGTGNREQGIGNREEVLGNLTFRYLCRFFPFTYSGYLYFYKMTDSCLNLTISPIPLRKTSPSFILLNSVT
ncbi:MAG: hypothetical protein ACK5RY_14865 [Dolichospermum sp.]|nr:hypothetical protein [Anabaena sp. 49628_E55]